jgi:hypothetical protein
MSCDACRTESSKKKPPIYKVMLHNDNYNRREYVVKILLKTVEGLTVDDAVNVMQVNTGSCSAQVPACLVGVEHLSSGQLVMLTSVGGLAVKCAVNAMQVRTGSCPVLVPVLLV